MQTTIPLWGEPGCPLLPEALRKTWTDETLPYWLAQELGLRQDATMNSLDATVWERCTHKTLPPAVKKFLQNIVLMRRGTISHLPALTQPWPRSLNPALLSWSSRTRNCLRKAGLLSDTSRLSSLTFKDLFAVKAMGVLSILDFTCVVEAALAPVQQKPSRGSSSCDVSELLGAIDSSWSTQVSTQDPRFSDLLPPGNLTIFERLEQLTAEPEDPPIAEAQLARAIPLIRERLSTISKLPLETALSKFVEQVAGVRGATLQALLRRLGCDGSPPVTLEEAASTISATREWMRQIQKRFTERAPTHPIYMPQLDEAIRVLRESAPTNAIQAADLIRSKGISVRSFHPRSVLSAAEFSGRPQPFEIDTSLGFPRVVVETAREFERAAIQVASRQAHASGATNIQEVSAELVFRGLLIPMDQSLRRLLMNHPEFERLTEDWLWDKAGIPERNRLRNITRKMLSVTSHISVGELREGVHRHYKIRGTRGISDWPLLTPPRAVLLEFYRVHPEFSVDAHGLVSSVGHLDSSQELNSTERILLDVLRSSPACLLDRNSLEKKCISLGMNPNTFSQYLSASPVISHVGTDMWSLRGIKLDPTAVEALREANAERPNERRIIDHGWTEAGNLWLAARLPDSSSPLVLGIPSAIRRFVKGREFQAMDEFGSAVGTVRVNDEGTSYGYGPFLTRRGADAGDILLISFRISEGLSTLRLIDDEELDAISPVQ
jgi:hypothetical protein